MRLGEKAFGELEEFIKTFLKLDKAGQIVVSTTMKLTWNFKQNELDILQASLERFKSSLDLILGVLNLASSAKYISTRSLSLTTCFNTPVGAPETMPISAI